MYKLLKKFSITVLVVFSVFASSVFVSSSTVFAAESNSIQNHQQVTTITSGPNWRAHTIYVMSMTPGPSHKFFEGMIDGVWYRGLMDKMSEEIYSYPEGQYYITKYFGLVSTR
ncbi:hypothetical protein [Sporosarcina limicola]|uniref:Uncharacterized protein n=1 Tax=Sporosarcina limicola TaxID=34101 RepID=A0A927ML37_9BACL|nr:hypothetical protein [Sporosarcina limicola]MBE1554922.1 hypothetical protein [Sporosarcina limicola]